MSGLYLGVFFIVCGILEYDVAICEFNELYDACRGWREGGLVVCGGA